MGLFNRHTELVNKDELVNTLTKMFEILQENAYSVQADAVRKPLEALLKSDISSFKKTINTVDLWGGSGAAWEVYIPDRTIEREYQKCIIDLYDQLKMSGIRMGGMRGIVRVFKNDLKRQ